jgi:tRNA-(ms[2]io[6]A)-hydroxylase
MTSTAILCCATPRAWFEAALADLPSLLVDHASCEKKAASTALSLMFAYAEDLELGRALARLAREELKHYEQVLGQLQARAVPYRRQAPSRYAHELRAGLAREEPERRLDLLLIAALIEARSAERFAGLIPSLDPPLRDFYAGLEHAETRHEGLYREFAMRYARRMGLDLAKHLQALAGREAELILAPDTELRFHSGVPIR